MFIDCVIETQGTVADFIGSLDVFSVAICCLYPYPGVLRNCDLKSLDDFFKARLSRLLSQE